MANPWAPDQTITVDHAEQLISKDFPELHPVHAELLGYGFDNTVFKVNGQYVFRFPRREIAVDLLKTEESVLPLLAGLGMAVPVPLFSGNPGCGYKWPYLGYRHVPGKTPVKWNGEQQNQNAQKLAYFLKALHGIPVETAENSGAEPDTLGRLDMNKRTPMLRETAAKLSDLLPESPIVKQLKTYVEKQKPLKQDSSNCLVHGDLHIRNVLVDEEGSLTGVIDWGDLHIGHPAVDLSAVYGFFTPYARKVFFEIYGNVSSATAELARFKGIYTLSLLLLYGIDQKDNDLISLSEQALGTAMI
ncbi:phosphotransferase [Metabacillus indicus]|uniref:phosphotransferase n=1 Tax=Metabacillus indicus TaxID=246786 RepID=UPI002493BB6B|nr:phosphotransferase [Metabacillus indicus]